MAVGALTIAGRVGLFGCLLLALLLKPKEPNRDDTSSREEIVEIMDMIRSGAIEEKAKEVSDTFILTAAGDICVMRYGRLMPGIDRQTRQQLAAAAFALQDGGQEILDRIEAAPGSSLAWRVHIEQAMLAWRAGDADAAAAALALAAAVPDMPNACRSDEALMAARIALAHNDLREAGAQLDRATVLDPGHFAAHLERAAFGAAPVEAGSDGCVDGVRRVVESTIFIEQLMKTSGQLSRIADRASAINASGGRKALLDGFVLERSGQPEAAMAIYRDAADNLRREDGSCHAELTEAFGKSLDRVLNIVREKKG